jgi:hydroxymethylbilane synthase
VSPPRTLRIGTRGSALALWQAERIAALLDARLGVGSRAVVIKTSGDTKLDLALHKMEGKGFFTKELQEALLEDRVDLVVHSLKDLPTEEPDGLRVAAIPERARSQDVLLARAGTLQVTPDAPMGLAAGAVLGTSSLRRAAQALAATPGLRIEALRGNVPTRVRKLRDGAYDAILVAAAGLDRLALDVSDLDVIELGPELMLPAPAQGALAVETRADDEVAEILAPLHDAGIARCITAERRLLGLLGGGCHLPLGCLAGDDGDAIELQAVLGEVDEAVTRARLARATAREPDPEAAARACFEQLRAAMPESAADAS